MVIEEHAALDVITKDGSTYAIGESQIIRGSLTTSQSCSSGGGIPVGSCNTGTASVAFHAPSALSYEKLFGAKVKLYVWYGDTSKKQVGVYNVTSTERSYGVYTLSLSDNVYLLDEACYSNDTTTAAQNWLAMQLGEKKVPSVIFNMICNAYSVPHWNAAKNEESVPESGIGALSVKVPSDCCTESVKDFANYLAEYLGAIIMPDENGELHFAYMGSRNCPITIDASNIERDTYQKSPFHVSTSSWRVNHDSGIWTSWSVSGDFPENAAPLSIVVNNNPFWQSVEDGTPESMVRGRTETMLRYMWVAQGKVAYIDNVPQINPFRCTVHVPYYFRAGDRVKIIDPITSEVYHSYVTDVTWTFRGGQQISCAGEDTRTLSVSTSRNGAKKMSDYSRYLYRKSKSNTGGGGGDANTYTKAEIDAKDAAVKSVADKAQGTADGAVSVNNTQNTQIAALQKSAHTHSNKSVLDKIEQPYTTAERDKLAGLENYTHPTYTAHAKGFYKFASDGEGHVTDAEEVTASDLYNAGGVIKNFLNFADYTGHMPIAFMSTGTSGSFGDYAKFVVDTRETSVSKMFMLSIGGNGIEGRLMLNGTNGAECVIFPNSNSSNSNRFHFFLPDKSGTVALIEDIPDIAVKQDKLTAGTNVTISGSTISAKDTTYSDATQSTHGLMTAADKKKLDGMDLSKYLPKDGTAEKAKMLSTGQMRSAYCTNGTASFSDGYIWFKIGTAAISGAATTVVTTFLGTCGYGKHALYTYRVRLTSTGNAIESMSFFESGRTGGMLTGLFRVVGVNGEKSASLELWAKIPSRWEGVNAVILNEMQLNGAIKPNFWVLTSRGYADAQQAPTSGNMYVDSSDNSICATAAKATEATTLTDSGWVATTRNTTFTAASTVKCRKYGQLVEVRGDMTFSSTYGSPTVCTLPAGYRPAAVVQTCGYTPSGKIFGIKVDTAGVVSFSSDAAGTFVKSTTYRIDLTYLLG